MKLLPPVPLLVKVFAGAALIASALIGACSGPEGVTPDCKYNVGGNGLYYDSEGCEQFAKCNKKDPRDCCTESDGGRVSGECTIDDDCVSGAKCIDVSPGDLKVCTGSAMAMCLHGYGVVADVSIVTGGTGGSGGGGSGGSTGSGGTGTGGTGTGGTGTGGAGTGGT